MLGADYDVLHGHYPISMLPVLTTRIPYLYTFHAPVYKEVVGERQEPTQCLARSRAPPSP